jgi:hypothetical protein
MADPLSEAPARKAVVQNTLAMQLIDTGNLRYVPWFLSAATLS